MHAIQVTDVGGKADGVSGHADVADLVGLGVGAGGARLELQPIAITTMLRDGIEWTQLLLQVL